MQKEMRSPRSIALLGAPNSGKTTLFNAITGKHAQTGNWPGVTVDVKFSYAKSNPDLKIYDLPGVYSLHDSSSPEEETAQEYLNSGNISGVICMVAADQPRIGLTLAMHVKQHGIPVSIALIRQKYLKKHNGAIDLELLSKISGIPIIVLPQSSRLDAQDILKASGLPESTLTFAGGNIDNCPMPAEIVNELLEKVFTPPSTDKATVFLDSVLLRTLPSIITFTALMMFVMFLAFGPPGAVLTRITENLIFNFGEWLAQLLINSGASQWLVSLIQDGIIAGVGGVLVFVPQFFVLFLMMGLLEASGYMARAAFMLDPFMRKIGLSGKSVIPYILGFGCTVPALVATRALPKRDRFIVLATVSFASCGARLPVYAAFAAVFFPQGKWILIPTLYVGGIAVAVIISSIYSKATKKKAYPFIMELPSYRFPATCELLGYAGRQAFTFIKKAGTVIFLASVVIWILMNFGPSGSVQSPSDSLLAAIGGFIAPLLAPLGFGGWKASTALITGLVAKEAVIGTLSILGGGQGITSALGSIFTSRSALSFLIFVLLYIPCIAAVATLWGELEKKINMLYIVVAQLSLSYLLSLAVYAASGLFIK
ncbi:MAG: ferrous iron transport protein B [Clostridiales bacterium]|nr:ferrous iron transport protein B [Clostridiales bacterium]